MMIEINAMIKEHLKHIVQGTLKIIQPRRHKYRLRKNNLTNICSNIRNNTPNTLIGIKIPIIVVITMHMGFQLMSIFKI